MHPARSERPSPVKRARYALIAYSRLDANDGSLLYAPSFFKKAVQIGATSKFCNRLWYGCVGGIEKMMCFAACIELLASGDIKANVAASQRSSCKPNHILGEH